MENFLNRSDAPFQEAFWTFIDETVKGAAISQLSARKLLYTEGPYGLGLQFIPGTDVHENAKNIQLSSPGSQRLTLIDTSFTLPAWDIAAHIENGVQMNTTNIIKSVFDIAAKEDEILFYGSESLGIQGLLNSKGVQKFNLKPWDQVGDAVETIIAAVDKLDAAGFHGPYTLGLSPVLYNKLFRRYPQTEILEIDHLKSLVSDGIIKAAAIRQGGVLLSGEKEFMSIILGQDLTAGFEGPSGRDYVFTISESLTLRLMVPEAVCVLTT